MVTEGQLDQILSGISLGMSLEDMFILCEISPEDMDKLNNDPFFKAKANAQTKKQTYNLLQDLQEVIEVQKEKGKDHAITWLLEKTNPRFASNSDGGDKSGIVNIFTQGVELSSSDTVEINIPVQPENEDKY